MKNGILLLFLGLLSCSVFAQSGKEKKANKLFDKFSYRDAIEKYEEIDLKTPAINRNLALSYQNIGNSKKAEEYYMKLMIRDYEPLDMFNYATVLRSNGKYHESEVWLEKYNKLAPNDKRAEKYMSLTGTYVALRKDEGMFSIKNLSINSPDEDFGATYFHNKVVFSSTRKERSTSKTWNWNGLPFLDLYVSELADDGELTEPMVFGEELVEKYHEGPATFSFDGNFMVFTRNDDENKSEDGYINFKLYASDFYKGEWYEPEALHFNSNDYSVGHPTLAIDGSMMYFASDMPGGIGGVDIYKVERDELGNWGEPVNMGAKINTEGDEMFPFIHEDGYLFFASNGHVGLGGLDIFVSQIKGETIGDVSNLGYPINDKQDDFSFIINTDLSSGFFSSNRAGGKGDDDIYSIKVLKPFAIKKVEQ